MSDFTYLNRWEIVITIPCSGNDVLNLFFKEVDNARLTDTLFGSDHSLSKNLDYVDIYICLKF